MNYRGSSETLKTEHAQASATETEVTGDVEKVLQMLPEDCRQHEEVIEAEKIQCEQEGTDHYEAQNKTPVEGSSPHMQNIHCANIIVIRGSETRPLWWSQTDYMIQIYIICHTRLKSTQKHAQGYL